MVYLSGEDKEYPVKMMKTEDRLLLTILKEALKGKSCETGPLDDDTVERLMNTAGQHRILPLVYDAVYRSEGLKGSAVLYAYRKHMLADVAGQIGRTEEFRKLLGQMQDAGLDPVIVKGLVCQALYPKPDLRISVDEDLYVPDESFAAVHRFLTDAGLYTIQQDVHTETADEISYRRYNSPLYIELHRSLFPAESEAYADLNRFFEHAAEHTVHVQVRDMDIRTLSPTDHLLYLILHAFKHFLHSGIGIRPVCDIGLFADHKHQEINWDHLRECLNDTGAFHYTCALFRIIDGYLLPDNTFTDDIRNWETGSVDEEAMLEDILSSGIHGASSMSRLHSSTVTLNAVTNKGTGSHLVRSVFLPLSSMKRKYPYLEKKPYLLPAAWIQRIHGYLKETKETPSDDVRESIRIGKRRIRLLEQYHVIPEKDGRH